MAGIKMKSNYGGYEIRWDDFVRKFIIFKEDVEVKEKLHSLEECEKWIDLQNKKKFKRIKVLYNFNDQSEDLEAGEATSLVDGDYVWITSGRKKYKVWFKYVWLDTTENREILKVVDEKNKQMARIRDEIVQIKTKAICLTKEMMLEE
jgi:hypothetical protein